MNQAPQTSQTRAEKIGLSAVRCANKAIRIFEDIVFIIILLIGLWYLADTIYVFYHSRADVMMPYKPENGNIAELQRALSEEAVAWITLDDTSIDYPVMQGVDNYAYLNRDPYGDYSLAGSIFLDSRNAPDFSDAYSLIYGHHMSGGYMFGALDSFEDVQYFQTHTKGTLSTQRGEFPIETIAFLYTDAGNDLIFDPNTDPAETFSFIKKQAMAYREVEGARIVALTTCKSPTSTRRACLFVKIIENDA